MLWVEVSITAAHSKQLTDASFKALMAKIYSEQDEDISTQDLMKRALWTDKQHKSADSAVHSRFMKPSCRPILEGSSQQNVTLILLGPLTNGLGDAENGSLVVFVS